MKLEEIVVHMRLLIVDCTPMGRTAVNLESGVTFILPLELAQLGFDCASAK
jgi:hypothetical protein